MDRLPLIAGMIFALLEISALVRIFIINGLTWGLISIGALILSLLILLLALATISGAISSIRNGRWAEVGLYSFLLIQNRTTLLPAIIFCLVVVMAILITGLSI